MASILTSISTKHWQCRKGILEYQYDIAKQLCHLNNRQIDDVYDTGCIIDDFRTA